jgi:DNA polymerase I-like protein with 3'-5' exonuclease and polymerase domains
MTRLVFDIETNGFLDVLTCVHCLTVWDVDTGEHALYAGVDVEVGLRRLQEADKIIGHNVIKFDVPAIKKVYPWWSVPQERIRDTIVLTRLIWPELKKRDAARAKAGKFPGKLIGKHTLKAWGVRIGNFKGEYEGGWETYTDEMGAYCDQDGSTTVSLLQRCERENYSEEAIELEHQVAWIIAEQEQHGVMFDEPSAQKLHVELVARKEKLERELETLFDPWFVAGKVFTPKRDNKKQGYTADAPFTRVELTTFNPTSRDQIGDRLTKLYGWKPEEYTDGGKPKVDESTISVLDYPPCVKLTEYLTIAKRLGQLVEGKQAWLKCVRPDGRIHGGVITNGCVTGRMTHQSPNLGQVPAVGKPYGAECRALFCVPADKKQVGADAAALELCMLGHYMAKYDGGAYSKAVTEGKQADGTDVHTLNCLALGFEPKKLYTVNGKQNSGRQIAKRFIYAFLYGCGDAKAASILGVSVEEAKKIKARFLKKLPALKMLIDAVRNAVRTKGYLRGLDGRVLAIRSQHAALNTLLQSAGAVVMKKALVIFNESLRVSGLSSPVDYAFVLNVHDEWQLEVKPELAGEVGTKAVDSIRAAGTYFHLRCPLSGEFKIGDNWRDTH